MRQPQPLPGPPEPPLHDGQKELLDRRLEAAEKNPDSWLSWDEVRELVFGPNRKES